jgi:hypothetical protein
MCRRKSTKARAHRSLAIPAKVRPLGVLAADRMFDDFFGDLVVRLAHDSGRVGIK